MANIIIVLMTPHEVLTRTGAQHEVHDAAHSLRHGLYGRLEVVRGCDLHAKQCINHQLLLERHILRNESERLSPQ